MKEKAEVRLNKDNNKSKGVMNGEETHQKEEAHGKEEIVTQVFKDRKYGQEVSETRNSAVRKRDERLSKSTKTETKMETIHKSPLEIMADSEAEMEKVKRKKKKTKK